MKCSPAVLFPVLVAPLALMLSGELRLRACPTEVVVLESTSFDLDDVETQIELLWSGTTAERETAVEEAWARFRPYGSDTDEEQVDRVREQIETLVLWMAAEPDPWLVSRLLQRLAHFPNRAVDPLFVAALEHPSPNVRRAGVARLMRFVVPDAREKLEALWDDEALKIVLPEIAVALACQSSDVVDETVIDWLRADEVSTKTMAATLVRHRVLDEGKTELIRMMDGEDEGLRRAAVEALSAWPEDERVRRAVLRATDALGKEAPGLAISALVPFDDEEVREKIVDHVLRAGHDGGMTIFSLADASPDLRTAVLAGIEQRAEPDLAAKLTEYAEFAWSTEFAPPSLTDCDLHLSIAYPDVPERFRAVPASGGHSIRCRRRPGREGRPSTHPRLPEHAELHRVDLSIEPDEPWVQLRSSGWPTNCWAPLSELVDADTPIEDRPARLPARLAEFDVMPAELDSAAAERLREAGLLRVIDPGVEAIGVELRIDAYDPASASVLAEAFEQEGGVLDVHVAYALRDFYRLKGGNKTVMAELSRLERWFAEPWAAPLWVLEARLVP